MEKKVQTKQRAEEPMERVTKGEACRSGLKPTPLQGQAQPSPVDFRGVPLGGRRAAKGRALPGEKLVKGDSV